MHTRQRPSARSTLYAAEHVKKHLTKNKIKNIKHKGNKKYKTFKRNKKYKISIKLIKILKSSYIRSYENKIKMTVCCCMFLLYAMLIPY